MSSYYHPQHLVTYTQHYQPQWFDNPDLAACFGYGLMQHGGGGGSEGDGHARTAGQHLDQAPDLHPPDFRAPPTRPFHVRQQARQLRQRPPPSMAAFNAITDEEMAEMQKRSNEYEPEATGPLVGHREPSTAITTEYALGDTDPVFQAKTRALPLKFSHYRKVRGDGRCGWRAIAFGYFEALVHLGDANKFLEEETRLRSLTNVVTSAGIDLMLFEDFADEAYDLLRKCRDTLNTANAETALIEAFNDESLQNYIITYLKTLTSSWMKSRPEDWAPWLLGRTVEKYCDDEVMPTGSEIDNVSLIALKDVLLSPAGIALEVLYLDRSEGEEVNTHRMDPVTSGGFTVGTVRLLYRPGHYDILYKAEDIPPSAPIMPTYLQYSSHTHHEPAYDLGMSDFMIMIPGMSYATPQACWSGSNYGSSDFADGPSPVQPCSQASAPIPMTPIVQPQIQPQPVFTQATPTLLASPPTQITQNMAIRPAPRPGLVPATAPLQQQLAGGGPFRPSAWELEADFMSAHSQLPFTTSIFRNSHFNTAHFLNPDFQPEEWRPDDDYSTTAKQGARHKVNG